jgi:hypothetical protein
MRALLPFVFVACAGSTPIPPVLRADAAAAPDHVDVVAPQDVVTIDTPAVTPTDAAVAPTDAPDVAPPPDAPATLRVLFIGNSYTYYNDLPAMIATLGAPGAGTPSRPHLEVESVTEGGATVQRHWEAMRQDRVRVGPWNAVVLQGQSVEPIAAFTGFDTYVGRFAGVISEAGARAVLFATWARRSGDAVYAQPWSGGDFAAMSARLNGAYRRAGMNHGAEVAPVGAEWALALTDRPALGLYDADGSHPSLAGSYLAACVLYRALTGVAVSDAAPVPSGLAPGDAAFLRAVSARP